MSSNCSHASAIGVYRRGARFASAQARVDSTRKCIQERKDIRVLIDEAGAVVDLVVDDHVQVLLGVVGGNLSVGKGLAV